MEYVHKAPDFKLKPILKRYPTSKSPKSVAFDQDLKIIEIKSENILSGLTSEEQNLIS